MNVSKEAEMLAADDVIGDLERIGEQFKFDSNPHADIVRETIDHLRREYGVVAESGVE